VFVVGCRHHDRDFELCDRGCQCGFDAAKFADFDTFDMLGPLEASGRVTFEICATVAGNSHGYFRGPALPVVG
jgi:hypothetical protein